MRPARHPTAPLAALVLGLALLLPASGPARADDKPAPNPSAAPEPATRDTPKDDREKKDGGFGEAAKDGPKDEPAVRLDRAKKLVQELETTIAILKAAKTVDPETMRALERMLTEARKLAQPIESAKELTEEERIALAAELGKKDETAKEPAAPNPIEDWRQRALASAFQGADLNEDEQIAASEIIQDWFRKSDAARIARDTKAMSDLKSERDKGLEKALGRKKAQKVVNNLNSLSGWRR